MQNVPVIAGNNFYEALLSHAERLFANRISHALGKAELMPLMGIECGSAGQLPLVNVLNGLSAHPAHQLSLILAIIPEIAPGFLSRLLKERVTDDHRLLSFGGVRGKQHRGILPTGETLQFLLGGKSLPARLSARDVLAPDSPLIKERILCLLPAPAGEPRLAGQLCVDGEWLEQMLTGRITEPTFSRQFPAQRIDTDLNWEDIVLNESTHQGLQSILNYLKFHKQLDGESGFGRYARRGYRALFYGPPGTGKTLTASLLGNTSGRPVFRVDLAMVVSKYIGETEKNLSMLFEKAEHKDWILFFDEADALFGKRTEQKEGKDRYANQEISFLLQRVENYNGLVILATNFRNNLDLAFTRRFEAIVPFQLPAQEERLLLWKKMVPANLPLSAEIDLHEIASRFELSGASIANLLRHATIEAMAAGEKALGQVRIYEAIKREFAKENKLFPVS